MMLACLVSACRSNSNQPWQAHGASPPSHASAIAVATSSAGSPLAAASVPVVSGASAVPAGSAALRIVQIQAAGQHTFALRSDGTLFGWGSNTYGVLSTDKALSQVATPRRIEGLPKVSQVSSGAWHACAITETEDVICWGRSFGGALGNGSMKDESFVPPARVAGISNVSEVAANSQSADGERTYFRKDDGNVFYVGVVHGYARAKLQPAERLAQAAQIATNAHTACAVKTSGAVVCEGLLLGIAYESKLGYTDKPLPHLPKVRKVALGPYHACAVTAQGQVYCWGSEEATAFDRSGYSEDTDANRLPVPRRVDGLKDVVDIAVWRSDTCVVQRDGRAFCWKRQDEAMIGKATPVPPARPQEMVGISEVAATSMDSVRVCYLDRDGQVFCQERLHDDSRRGVLGLAGKPSKVNFQ